VANEIEDIYGLPIVNRRVSLTLIHMLTSNFSHKDLLKVSRAIDDTAQELQIDLIGGSSALVHKNYCESERRFISSMPEV